MYNSLNYYTSLHLQNLLCVTVANVRWIKHKNSVVHTTIYILYL